MDCICIRYGDSRWQRHSKTTILCSKQAVSIFFLMFERSEKCTFSFLLYVHVCMNYGVISRRHASTDCVWPITLVAGFWLYNLPWRVSVSIHQVQCNISTLRPYWEKTCTCFLNDAETPTMYGCALWCSQNVYTSIRSYSMNTTTTFYFVTECPDVTVLVWGDMQVTTHSYFTRPWPGLDSIILLNKGLM